MELFLRNHEYKYAVEQIMLLLFPGEKPLYPSSPSGDFWAEITLFRSQKRATASCKLCKGGKIYLGRAAISNTKFTDKLSEDSCLQRIIKSAFYRAGIKLTGAAPPWGAVTGVRPGKLMSAFLRDGMGDRAAKTAFMTEFDVSPSRSELCLQTAKHSLVTERSLLPRDICLYIGIPFCPTRCAYCSFVSQTVSKSGALVEPFLAALMQDISETARAVSDASLRVVSVYLGGGTPTSLDAQQLDKIFGSLYQNFDLSHCREITVEAGRPDTITREKLDALSRGKVTRISVNPQSMDDNVLRAIGRSHSAQDVISAMELVRTSGSFEVNMDLIAGLPADSFEGFSRSLDACLALSPENITIHTLSLKKGSRIMLDGTALPPIDDTVKMVNHSREQLSLHGFEPYYLYRQKYMSGALENTGWCLKGKENLYNICIMEELCGIISMGAGASTKLIAEGGRMLRRFAPKYPTEYIASIDRIISQKSEIKEFYDGI